MILFKENRREICRIGHLTSVAECKPDNGILRESKVS